MRYDRESNQIQYTFAKCIEMCYYLRNFNLVLPYSFLSNLVQSCISGSKSVSVVNRKTTPGGSYITYKNWINVHGKSALKCYGGTIDLWFDNIGRYINKQYRVSTEKTKSADVVTTCLQIPHDDIECMQKNPLLKSKRSPQENAP